MATREVDVQAGHHRLRLDRFLREACPELSRKDIERLLRTGAVEIISGSSSGVSEQEHTERGRVGNHRTYVKRGDRVRIRDHPHDVRTGSEQPAASPRILERSAHLLAVGKPPGMPTVPVTGGTKAGGAMAGGAMAGGAMAGKAKAGETKPGETKPGARKSLLEWVSDELAGEEPRLHPGVLHRLDQATSGILLFSLSPAGHRVVTRLLRQRTLEKQYLGAIRGHLSPATGSIELPLKRDASGRMRAAAGGVPSRTGYRTIESGNGWSLLELDLHTGRFHQLRAHLAALRHPLLGDDRYGSPTPELTPPRLWLHAARLAFPPEEARRLGVPATLECPLWPDLEAHLSTCLRTHPRGRAGS